MATHVSAKPGEIVATRSAGPKLTELDPMDDAAGPGFVSIQPAVVRRAQTDRGGGQSLSVLSRIATVQSLQRTHGNRFTARLLQNRTAGTGRIDRYQELAANAYTPRPGVHAGQLPMFKEASPDTQLDAGNAQIRYPTQTKNNPPLLAADDQTLAINKTANEPKEFYAIDQVVNAANQTLTDQEQPVELDNSGGHALDLGGQSLKIVRPKRRGQAVNHQADEFAKFTYDICIKMALEIMGSLSNSVQGYRQVGIVGAGGGGGGTERVQMESNLEGTQVPEVIRLARYLTTRAGRNVSLKEAAAAMQSGTFDGTPIGKEYGTLSGKGQLDTAAQTLGINKHARATRIGQGFVTQTVATGEEKPGNAPDYSVMTPGLFNLWESPTRRSQIWGYHYAAVVALSLDKRDSVTLENYNRNPETKKALEDLRKQLEVQFRQRFGQPALNDLANVRADRQRIGQIQARLQHGADATAEQAAQIAKQITSDVGTMWYFRIVGQNQGQSFHEQMAASGYFANPLTMVVEPSLELGGGDGETNVLFDDGADTLPIIEGNIMRGQINNIKADFAHDPRRYLVITGYMSKNEAERGVDVGLMKQRAERAKDVLVGGGVSGTKILTGAGVATDKFTGTTTVGDRSTDKSNQRVVLKMEG